MNIVLLVIMDERCEYTHRSLASAAQHLPPAQHLVVVEDPEHLLGYAGAIQLGWQRVLETDADWVFHLEADFTFRQQVPLAPMVRLLMAQPYLCQVALKRQPWNDQERAAGGIVEQHPDEYQERYRSTRWMSARWTEHHKFFTTNPSVYSRRLCYLGWPQESESEGKFTHQLLASDPQARFAFWGGKFDPPMVDHIGDVRTGCGY